MKKIYSVLFLMVISYSIQAQDVSQKLNNYLGGRGKSHNFNGTALIVHRGHILIYKGYGYKNAITKTLNDTSTIYRIGSLSKPFTALLIMHLEQKKLLSLHDHLSRYIPDYPNGDSITIENLLTHSSGIKDYLEVKAIQQLPDSAPPISMDQLIDYFKDEPSNIQPGEKFSYSNSNYILLARIVEKVTGKKFEDEKSGKLFSIPCI